MTRLLRKNLQSITEARKKIIIEIQRKMAIGLNLELDKIRELQVMYKFIGDMLDHPVQFFSVR